MNLTSAQFAELADHYGKFADSTQKKQDAEQARADAEQAYANAELARANAEQAHDDDELAYANARLTYADEDLAQADDDIARSVTVIDSAQAQIDALLPDDLSAAERAELSEILPFHPSATVRRRIDEILPGFAAYADSTNLTEDQFQAVLGLIGEWVKYDSRMTAAVQADDDAKISRIINLIEDVRAQIEGIFPHNISKADNRQVFNHLFEYYRNPPERSEDIDEILPGFASYAALNPHTAPEPAAPPMTAEQFDELGNLFTEWNRILELSPNTDEERASVKASFGKVGGRISEIFPKDLLDGETGRLFSCFSACYDPQTADSSRANRIIEIEEILPGFATYAESYLPKSAPPAAPKVIQPSADDIREFGQVEADFIAGCIQKGYTNASGVDLVQIYRQALRNGGPVRGFNYLKNDVNVLRQSPENITLFEQRFSGRQQSLIDEYIKLTLLAVAQCMEIAKIDYPYECIDIYSSIKVHLREPLEEYQKTCERVFSDLNKGQDSNSLFMLGFSSPKPEDIAELREAVALRSKVRDPYKKHMPLIPAAKSNDVYGPYEYRKFENAEDQLAFISLFGDIEPGEKGGLFRKGTPDRFLGVEPAKLQAYKDILAVALPRMIKKAVNLEYEKIFIERKLAPDYLLFRNLYGGEVGAAGFCKHCYQVGAENVVPELLYRYGASSAQDIENAYGKELAKNSAYHRAVLAAEDEIHKRDVEWNDHVRNTVRGSNVMVAEPLKKKYLRNESYYAEGKKEEAIQLVQSRGIYPSDLFPPRD